MFVTTKQIDTYILQTGYHIGHFEKYVHIGARVLNKLNLWQWIKNKEPSRGFAWSNDPNITNYVNEFIKTGGDDHSTIIVVVLRYLQGVASFYIKEDIKVLCAICLEEDTSDKFVLDCNHIYHIKCIKQINDEKCPLCRQLTVPHYE